MFPDCPQCFRLSEEMNDGCDEGTENVFEIQTRIAMLRSAVLVPTFVGPTKLDGNDSEQPMFRVIWQCTVNKEHMV